MNKKGDTTERLIKERAEPSARKVRVIGGKGSEAGLVRHALYKVAWERYNSAIAAEFYFEAITLVDSMITDRIEAYIQHLLHFEEKHQKVMSLGEAVSAMDVARNERRIKSDVEYKKIKSAIIKFVEGRNKAVHNFVILHNDNAEMTAEDRISKAAETARYGRELFNLVNAYTRKQMYGAKNGE